MAIVTITLNNKNFQLYCNSGEEEKLLFLANKLNEKISEIKAVNPAASFDLLLVIAGFVRKGICWSFLDVIILF